MKVAAVSRYALISISISLCIAGSKAITIDAGVRNLNPLQYGLDSAKTGEERYQVLLRTHKEAQKRGVDVTYAGIKEIDLTIPANAVPIPLTYKTDFVGAIIRVENRQKEMFLFTKVSKMTHVTLSGNEIDNQDYAYNPFLRSGIKLLVILDKTPWVENRRGYNYGASRKDIMLVKNGRGRNSAVQSYCTLSSNPEGKYRDVTNTHKTVFKNVLFERTATSTKKTYLVKIGNQYDVELSNITIKTPEETGMTGDRAVSIVNCLDVTLSDITINGTYSKRGTYGYGISLDNIYNLRVNNLYARANWGVFGNNNINKAYLKDCDLNRFDIHCYGRDVCFENCNFVDLYNQFSSFFGSLSFKNCTFTGFKPVLIESSYNAFTAFDLKFEHCVLNFDKEHYSVVDFSGFNKEVNSRPELRSKCLPNVTMKDCRVNLHDGQKTWYVYNTRKADGYEGGFSHISKVVVEGLSTNDKSSKMEVYSHKVKTTNKVEMRIRNK